MAKCLFCAEPVPLARRSDAVYCSDVCGNRARNRKHYARHPEGFTAKRAWLRQHRVEAGILSRAKWRAKVQGIPFSLTVADIVIPRRCPVLGTRLRTDHGSKGYHPDAPSIDRVKGKRGYVRGNVRIISARANLLKNDATAAELEKVIQYIRGQR